MLLYDGIVVWWYGGGVTVWWYDCIMWFYIIILCDNIMWLHTWHDGEIVWWCDCIMWFYIDYATWLCDVIILCDNGIWLHTLYDGEKVWLCDCITWLWFYLDDTMWLCYDDIHGMMERWYDCVIYVIIVCGYVHGTTERWYNSVMISCDCHTILIILCDHVMCLYTWRDGEWYDCIIISWSWSESVPRQQACRCILTSGRR